MYEAVVFDMDGVLLRYADAADAADAYRDAMREAFAEFDVRPPAADLEAFYGGAQKSLEGMRAVCERHGVDFEEFWPVRERRASAVQQEMLARGERVLYDDCDVLDRVAASHALGLVSSNQQATVDAVVERFDCLDPFECAYGRPPTVAGFERVKPDPHYLERALADLGTRDAVYVGDGAHDVLAAHRAGIDSAFVRRPHRDGYALPEEPTYEVDALTELPDCLDTD